jgi:hypothetical protein
MRIGQKYCSNACKQAAFRRRKQDEYQELYNRLVDLLGFPPDAEKTK